MLDVMFRPMEVWPQEPTRNRMTAPFGRVPWAKTLDKLERELGELRARDIVIEVAMGRDDIRNDGWPRANATARHPGVIISFESMHGPLRYLTDRFERSGTMSGWQANVRAIALGLEALRRVDRYGITKRGEQYTGWSALPSGMAMGARLSVADARTILIDCAEDASLLPGMLERPDVLKETYRKASKLHHPDAGGDPALFAQLQRAYERLTEGA